MTATTQAPVTAPGSTAHTDGAWAVIPVQTRDERPRSFEPADFEVPSGREVNWKHTPVDRIAPLFEDAATDESAMGYEVDAPEGVLELLGPEVYANFETDVQPVAPLERIGELFQQWAAAGR